MMKNIESRRKFTLGYGLLLLLTVFNLIACVFYVLIALVFFGNFDLSSLWGLGGFVFTMMAPVVVLVTFVIHRHYRSRKTAWVALLGTVVTIALLVIWQAEGSRGWIH